MRFPFHTLQCFFLYLASKWYLEAAMWVFDPAKYRARRPNFVSSFHAQLSCCLFPAPTLVKKKTRAEDGSLRLRSQHRRLSYLRVQSEPVNVVRSFVYGTAENLDRRRDLRH